MRKRLLPGFLCALLMASCQAPRPALRVDHPDASIKIPAMKKAVREEDRRQIELLIRDLDSDDPAVRLYAIEALQRLTGQTLGYHYWDDDLQRQPAIERWKAWSVEQSPAEPSQAQ